MTEEQKPGEIVADLADAFGLSVHQLHRTPAGAPARARIVHVLRGRGWTNERIDRFFGWQQGEAGSHARPPAPASTPKLALVATPPIQSLFGTVDELVASLDAEIAIVRSRLSRAETQRESRALGGQLGALIRSRKKFRPNEEIWVDNEPAPTRKEDWAKVDAIARANRQLEEHACTPPLKLPKKIEAYPRCQETRGSSPCGAMAITKTPAGEPACTYCAMLARSRYRNEHGERAAKEESAGVCGDEPGQASGDRQ
jgi:hypothetical protein